MLKTIKRVAAHVRTLWEILLGEERQERVMPDAIWNAVHLIGEAKDKTRRDETTKIAKNMLQLCLDEQIIAQVTGLSVEEIRGLVSSINNTCFFSADHL